MPLITRFRGEYAVFSNLYGLPVRFGKYTFPTAEAAFQAMKTKDEKLWVWFAACGDPVEARKKGRSIRLREDWDKVKDMYMYLIVKAKFMQNPKARHLLLSTGTQPLAEGNTHGDTYWGVCRGHGQNKLGKILMRVRRELLAQQIIVMEDTAC